MSFVETLGLRKQVFCTRMGFTCYLLPLYLFKSISIDMYPPRIYHANRDMIVSMYAHDYGNTHITEYVVCSTSCTVSSSGGI